MVRSLFVHTTKEALEEMDWVCLERLFRCVVCDERVYFEVSWNSRSGMVRCRRSDDSRWIILEGITCRNLTVGYGSIMARAMRLLNERYPSSPSSTDKKFDLYGNRI